MRCAGRADPSGWASKGVALCVVLSGVLGARPSRAQSHCSCEEPEENCQGFGGFGVCRGRKGVGWARAKQTILRGKWAAFALFSRFLENVWYIRGVNNSYLLAILTGVQPYVGPNAADLAAMLAQCDAALTDINSLLADMPKGSTD